MGIGHQALTGGAHVGLTSIKNIQKIMRAKHWLTGAQLMDEWFTGPPVSKPAYTTPDQTTIRMDAWILKFDRAKIVFDKMVEDKVWSNDKARPLMATRLGSLGMLTSLGACFDLSSKSVIE